ncbi:MAG TPA: hypothetical protein VEI01_10800 [Terriglobales bacterium]|nr:hypothetical protein [Terriglobales bacterium]
MLRWKKVITPSSVLIVLSLVLASSAFADNTVADQLSDFRRTAFELRQEADTLKSFALNKRLSWESHTDRLHALKGQVNQLGKSLAALEAQKSRATKNQSMAIEHARPHLVAVAQNLTRAIELVRENRDNVHSIEYAEAGDNIYAHANELHTKVDAILDYAASKMRLDRLELQPVSTLGN